MVILLEEKPSSLHPKKVRQVRSDINMFVLFFTFKALFIRNLLLEPKW